jgi:cytoskeletal protein CcmA (bactofilin family)
MIFNLGSFFNSAKRQEQAEREREQQIYARWAEASRRAEQRTSPGSNLTADSSNRGEWTVGSVKVEAEEEMTFTLTEADIVEGADLSEAEERGISAPQWLRGDEFEAELNRDAGHDAGEYLGGQVEEHDDRQFEFTFSEEEKKSEAFAPQAVAFNELFSEDKTTEERSLENRLEGAFGAGFGAPSTASRESFADSDELALISSKPLSDFVAERLETSKGEAVHAEAGRKASVQAETKAVPSESSSKPNVVKTASWNSEPASAVARSWDELPPRAPVSHLTGSHGSAVHSEKRATGFLRGLSAAVERTIASASAIGYARDAGPRDAIQYDTNYSAQSNVPVPPVQVQAESVQPRSELQNSGNSSMDGWNRLNAPVASTLARPARLSADGMVDDRVRPLDGLRAEAALAIPKPQKPKVEDGRVPPADMQVEIERDLRSRFGADIRSALGSGTVIEGKFTFDSPVRIDGSLSGEIVSNSLLIVGEHAIVRAKVDVGSLIVLGEVVGDVNAADLVEIRATGSLRGDLSTSRIAIETGGFYQGSISLKKTVK